MRVGASWGLWFALSLGCLGARPLRAEGDFATLLDRTVGEVVAAHGADQTERLQALAATDYPWRWLVADEVLARGHAPAALAFARASPAPEGAALSAYLEGRVGRPATQSAATARDRMWAALREADPATSLALLGGLDLTGEPVVATLVADHRGLILRRLGRPAEAAEAYAAGARAAASVGWSSAEATELTRQRASLVEARDLAGAQAVAEEVLRRAEGGSDDARIAQAAYDLGSLLTARGDHGAAVPLLERAQALLTGSDPPWQRIAVLGELGEALLHARRAADGVRRLSEARDLLLALPADLRRDQALLAIESTWGMALAASGDPVRGLEVLTGVVERLRAGGDKARLTMALLRLGGAYRFQGDVREAIRQTEAAHRLARELGWRSVMGQALSNLSAYWMDRGDPTQALAHARAALEVARTGGEADTLLLSLASVAVVGLHLEQYAEVIDACEEGLPLAAALGRADLVVKLHGVLGDVYGRLGDEVRSVGAHREAEAAARAAGDEAAAARAMADAAITLTEGDASEEGYALLEKALEIHERLGDREAAAVALGNLAGWHMGSGRWTKARAALERATALDPGTDGVGVSYRLWRDRSLAMVLVAQGRESEGRALLEKVIREADRARDRRNLVQSLGLLATLQLRAGDPALALATVHRAARDLESLLDEQADEHAAGIRERFDVVHRVGVQAATRLGDVAEAFHFLEAGRAGALLESLQMREAIREAALPEDLRREDAEARIAEAAAAAAHDRARQADDRAERREAARALDAAREGRRAVVERIQREEKAAASLLYPRPALLEEVQSGLRPGEAMVLLHHGETEVLAIVVHRDGARLVPLGPAARIQGASARVRPEDPDVDPAEALLEIRQVLVEPLSLPEDARRVLLVPDSAIASVPPALLFEGRDVVLLPSATTYGLLRDAEDVRGEGVLALGDPDYAAGSEEMALLYTGRPRLPPLPESRLEAQAVGTKVLLGAETTEGALRRALAEAPRWRAVHLACHGLVDATRPSRTALALTASEEDDGFLTVLDVFRARIPADLVVLSACRTARGRVVRGEGVLGLTRAAMVAGAPRVLCSLWDVDDAATRALMVEFYALWNPRDGSPGRPAAEALRRAQERVRAEGRWKHPYYWAAWVLWGLPD